MSDDRIGSAIRDAELRGRRQMREEAAKVADTAYETSRGGVDTGEMWRRTAASAIAAAIRALPALTLLLAACGQMDMPSLGCASAPDDDLSRAVLGNLWRHIDQYPRNVREIVRARDRLAALRKWAEALEDKCERRAYMNWLDYYSEEYRRIEDELAQDQRVNDLRDHLSKPPD